MISVKDIDKSFTGKKVLDGVSFNVNDGEIVGLLGPNGAGKTTTMRIMTGFLSADRGDILIDDFSINTNPIEAQKLIGYLPENNPLYRDMLVGEFLNYSASLQDLPKEKLKEHLDYAVSAVNINDVYYRPINELSKGFRQRVGLAASLLHKPKTLILDEPTEGLDPNQRSEIRKLIKNLSKGHTIVISTHVMQEVESLCDKMVVINKGKIVADGLVRDLEKDLKNEKEINLEIEGTSVKSALKSLEVSNLEILEVKNNYYKVKILADKSLSLQPEISKLAAKNNWILWRVDETKQNLEDVFQKLTQEKL